MTRPRRHVTVSAAVAAAVVLAAGTWAATPAAGASLVAELSADQHVVPPRDVPFAAAGGLHARLSPSGRMGWRLTAAGTTGPVTAAHVHLGGRGRDGRVILTLCAPCGPAPRGVIRVPRRVVAALRAGTAYVNARTVANPAGELRGQVGVVITAAITQSRVVPRHPRRAERRGVRAFTALLDARTLDHELVLQGIASRVTRVELRRAPPGANGPVVRVLCAPCAVRTTGSLRLTGRELRWLREDLLYVQVTTRRDPAGYARAQLTGA